MRFNELSIETKWFNFPAERLAGILRGVTLDGDVELAISRFRTQDDLASALADAQRRLRPLVGRATLMLYRAMVLNVNRLSPGDRLGVSWSYDRQGAQAYDGKGIRRYNQFVFTASAQVGDVAWAETLALDSMGEREIRLRHDAPLVLHEIEDWYRNVVRSDLTGETFIA